MKKLLITFISCAFVGLALTGCKPAAPEVVHVAKTVDLRNFKGDKVAFLNTNDSNPSARSAISASRGANKEFSYEVIGSVPRFIGENGVEKNHASFWIINDTNTRYDMGNAEFETIKNAVKISDDEKGIKFTFNRPAGFEKSKFTWVNVQFLDKVGHKSTGIGLGGDKLTDTDEDPKVEIVYPLVDPESEEETRFWIQITTDDYYADLSFKVVPVHGEGCVKAVQEDYLITDYLELSEDGIMTLKLTVPPVAKDGTLKHNIGLHMQKGSASAYTEAAGTPSDVLLLCVANEDATAEEIEASKDGAIYEYKIDFKELYNNLTEEEKAAVNADLKTNPYIWASLIYSYEIPTEGFEDFVFDTPWVISNVIKNPFVE